MPDRSFIDTNVIIYALGPASTKSAIAARLFTHGSVISTQVLSEMANVLSKRFHMDVKDIRKLVHSLESMCEIETLFPSTIESALDLKERYKYSWYDSLILATAIQAGCNVLYTEDMQNNQKIENLQIINPLK